MQALRRAIRDLSIKRKLTLIIMGTSSVALLLACTGFVTYELITFRKTMMRQISVLADIIGANSTAALSFDDIEAAEEMLDALNAEPHIIAACIYKKDGTSFARHPRGDKTSSCPPDPPQDMYRFEGSHLGLFRPIELDGERIGTIYLRSDLRQMRARLTRYAGIVVIVMGVSSLAALLLSSRVRQVIADPILHLVQTTKDVSDRKDYAIRAVKHSQDELGLLMDAFNEMLIQIQNRDVALQGAHDALEARVHERTKDLQHEITERRRAEEALQESNRRLEETLTELKATQQQILEQERLRALGQMASGIAHDFNNALSPLLGYSELLLDRPEHLNDVEKVTRYMQMMNTAAKDAASVVRRLREFYRAREEGEIFLPVDLNSLVEQVIMLTQPRWKDQVLARGLTIHIETDLQPIPRVAANEAEIREVLTNLIFNAVDAMPEGGTLSLRTRVEADHIFLDVRDTGIGMTDEVRQRCLEPFFSTKPERGTGLGLAMVYGIIQRHQGTLQIESAPGQGTTFSIRLPGHTAPETKERKEEVAGPARRLRVLLVEDELSVRELVTEYLAEDGHTVETATNGREGLAKFMAGWFDVVVTDQGMPEMAGDQLAANVKQLAPSKPVILLTGFGDLMKAADEQPAGVDIILSKPVTLAALRQTLAMVIGG